MVRALSAVVLSFAPTEAAKSQVFHFRHCLRSVPNVASGAKPDFPLLEHYTAHALPQWGVPDFWCTEGGMEVAKAAGASLAANFSVDPGKMSVSADIIMRDGDTAVGVLTGMKARSPVEYDALLYSTIDPAAGDAVCEKPDQSQVRKEINERFATVPLPWDLESAVQEFETVFGVGAAGSLRELGNVSISDGKMTGPPVVMSKLAQSLLYSRSSGIDYLSDRATTEQAQRFSAFQAYYRSVMDVTSEKAIESSWLLSLTLRDLFERPGHSSLNFGHDGNIDGIAAFFGLKWEAPPFLGGELLPTPPLSALRFIYDDEADSVSVSFVYIPYDQEPSAAAYSESPIKTWSRAEFTHATEEGLARHGAEECFRISPYGPSAAAVANVMV